MSKPAATTAENCQTHIGRICVALSVLALMSTGSLAAVPELSLRHSEQLDVSRLGKVSADERSVLRVEWRAATTGADEARSVQAMLDSLRRMEGTIGEVRRLIQDMPARQAGVAPVMAEQPTSEGHDPRIVAASVVAALLLALWWAQRRPPLQPPKPKAAITSAPAESPPPEPVPVAILPARTPFAENEATKAPSAKAAVGEPSAGRPKPVQMPAEEVPRAAALVAKADGAPPPPPPATPQPEPPVAPRHAAPEPVVAPPAADSHVIDFKLEDAEPEAVERENARLKKLQELDRRKDPERHKESNIDPTLELAEIMLSLGLEEGAAQTLVDYTESNPRQALHHWLKLLDIYRKSGNQEEFKEATEKLRRNFNIQAEDWAKANTAEAPSLESFSRLSEQIQLTWSRPEECIAYLRHLLEDNREGSRAGFPRPVAEEILLLIDILKQTSGAGQAAAT
jgi:hypothetical protein